MITTSISPDEMRTPEYGVRAILPHLQKFKGQTIWCPFDTAESNFVSRADHFAQTVGQVRYANRCKCLRALVGQFCPHT